ncbi:MAG: tetratricopeptide repeat protein [Acidobacteriaceae bacterium]|nr:tetratricopeptide repeat protein [Acidobacteriaceae bacterium]
MRNRRILVYATALVFAAMSLAAQQQQQQQSQAGQSQAAGPHPKSQKEVEALQKVQAAAQAGDPKAELQAIDNVLENFADTEYKPMLMQMALSASQQLNDYPQTLVWGDRILQSNPNDYTAHVMLAEAIAQHTRENDLDKQDSLKKIQDHANKALDLLKNADTPPAPGIQEAQWPDYKKQLTSQAYDALGQAASLDKKPADAVKQFQSAIEAQPSNSVAMARLSKAYVENKQYDDAISTADKVLAMNDAPAPVKTFAQQEKDAATKLKGAAK